MTIQDWGAIGEVVGAIAVVVTLGYLATQIRYARQIATDASRQSRADGVRDMILAVITHPEYRRAWAKATPDSDARLADLGARLGVMPDEADLIWNGACAWAYIHWSQFRAIKSPADERELRHLVAAFYSIPPMSVLWQHDELLRSMVDPEFVTWIDGVLASEVATPGAR